MNLTELITTAVSIPPAGTRQRLIVALRAEAGTDAPPAPVSLTLAAALYTAAAEDRQTLGLGLAPETGRMSVVLNLDHHDGVIDATVAGALRYMLDPQEETVTRLCSHPGCPGERIGATVLTSVCRDHLDVIVPGLLPNAGDDISPGDRAAAAQESRRRRLDAWESEARDAALPPAAALRTISELRAGQAHHPELGS